MTTIKLNININTSLHDKKQCHRLRHYEHIKVNLKKQQYITTICNKF